ncbi:MAG: cysteine desulfurase [Gordonia sp.]|nr:cysteine desulfurase [Gordonia sp. (in: high G+C Gram-positive bacteria)]
MSTTTELECSLKAIAEVEGSDLRAPLADGSTTRYINFDYAASSPALRSAVSRIGELLPTYSSVHRGAGYASQVTTQAYEDARAVVTEFVGAADDQCLVFTRNTTDSLNLLAGCVPGPVVVLDIEHHSNLLPWRDCHVVQAANSIEETVGRVDAELQRTGAALLAVTGASNVTGEILPIRVLADLAHTRGARIVVDGAQLVPHRRVSLVADGIDYLAFSGHKVYAPFGAGVLVGLRDWLDAAPAYLAGGGAVRNVTRDDVEWAPSPARHEGGSPNVLGAAALAVACEEIASLGDAAALHETALTEQLRWGLAAIDGVEVLKIFHDISDAVGVVSFVVEGHRAVDVARYLSTEHGIGVRDGRFCAHPLLGRLGHDGGAVRASLGLGSSSADIDALLSALAQYVTR